MTPIKFRAWDKKNKRMFQVNDINGMMQNTYYMNKQGNIECYEDEAELMQFTGLKDKNGKEIYEGDVVKHNYYGIGHVEYREGHFAVVDIRGGEKYQSYTKMRLNAMKKTCKVIGNIYENPELL